MRRFEKTIVDLLGLDEIDDIDRPCLLERRRLEFVFRHDDELALGELVAFDEIPQATGVSRARTRVETHRRPILRMEHAELRPMISNRGMQFNRDAPDRTRATLSTGAGRVLLPTFP